jgi:hypothetical protein
MNSDNRLPLALFLLRLSVFIVMFMWTLDKLLNPKHAAAVYKNFYFIGGMENIIFLIGAVEMIILAGFLLGYKKKWTYCAIFIFHAVSTLSSFKQYLSPFAGPNLLFFAAWPMLAACFVLFYLRDRDTLFTVGK